MFALKFLIPLHLPDEASRTFFDQASSFFQKVKIMLCLSHLFFSNIFSHSYGFSQNVLNYWFLQKKKKALAEKNCKMASTTYLIVKATKCTHFIRFVLSLIYVIFSFDVCIVSFQEMMEIFLHSDLGKLPKFHVKNLIQNWPKCRNCPLCWSFMNIFQKGVGACSGILLSFTAWRWLFCWLHMLYALLVRWS